MTKSSFSEFACSAARALDQVGEWWTPLILRDLALGLTRFDQLHRDLGIPRKILTDRLAKLVALDIIAKTAYSPAGTRFRYTLTQKGEDFLVTLVALMDWGDRWTAPAGGPPLENRHKHCGGTVNAILQCAACGQHPGPAMIEVRPGPGARAVKGTALVGKVAERHRQRPAPE